MTESYIYCIRAVGGAGPIKIGYSICPEDRLRSYHTISPLPLEIIAQTFGGQPLEGVIHKHLAAHRLHGEWFAPCDEVYEIVAAVKDDTIFNYEFGPAPAPAARKYAKHTSPITPSSRKFRTSLLDYIESARKASGQSARAFCLGAGVDHKVISHIRSGKSITLETIERFEDYISQLESAAPTPAEATP